MQSTFKATPIKITSIRIVTESLKTSEHFVPCAIEFADSSIKPVKELHRSNKKRLVHKQRETLHRVAQLRNVKAILTSSGHARAALSPLAAEPRCDRVCGRVPWLSGRKDPGSSLQLID